MFQERFEDIRVVVVADDPLVRSALAAELQQAPEQRVVAHTSPIDSFSDSLNLHQPDVVIWDAGWDADEGVLKSMASVIGDLPEPVTPIIALVPEVSQGIDVFQTGVRGLLLRNAQTEQLAAAIQAVLNGLAVLDGGIALEMQQPENDIQTDISVEDLTPREIEVLELVAEGLSNKGIAHELSISDSTVKFHINSVLNKLVAQSRTEAVVRAMRLGIIKL